MRNVFILLVLLIFAVPAYATTIYKRVDEKGVVNFIDEYKKVSAEFRNRVEAEEYLEEELPPVLSWNTATTIKEEVKTGNYGRDYWKRQLGEATANYEKAREELLKEGKRLISHRYGSKTQYQMFTEQLPSITERFETYKKQMIEAKAMLETFKNETQEIENTHGERAVSPKTDIYGRGETWWKEKAQPWKEQLKEANRIMRRFLTHF